MNRAAPGTVNGRLLEATAAQQLERDAVTWHAWGAGLTPAQFIERERRLREHPWARRAMKSYWWVDASGAPLSSCELFLDDAVAGERRGVAGTIASVFTEERLRGHGHAAQLLEALTAHVQTTRDDCLALTLFSEIGLGLYSRLGFCAVPSFDTFFTPLLNAPAGVELLEGPLPPPVHPPGDDETLRTLLSSDRLDWHLERERIYGELGARPRLPFHGARLAGQRAAITFTAYWKTNELQVLTLDARTEEATATLLAAARYAAHLAGLPTVRVWETSSLAAQLPHARRMARTDELPMFKPLAPGIQAWTRVERGTWA